MASIPSKSGWVFPVQKWPRLNQNQILKYADKTYAGKEQEITEWLRTGQITKLQPLHMNGIWRNFGCRVGTLKKENICIYKVTKRLHWCRWMTQKETTFSYLLHRKPMDGSTTSFLNGIWPLDDQTWRRDVISYPPVSKTKQIKEEKDQVQWSGRCPTNGRWVVSSNYWTLEGKTYLMFLGRSAVYVIRCWLSTNMDLRYRKYMTIMQHQIRTKRRFWNGDRQANDLDGQYWRSCKEWKAWEGGRPRIQLFTMNRIPKRFTEKIEADWLNRPDKTNLHWQDNAIATAKDLMKFPGCARSLRLTKIRSQSGTSFQPETKIGNRKPAPVFDSMKDRLYHSFHSWYFYSALCGNVMRFKAYSTKMAFTGSPKNPSKYWSAWSAVKRKIWCELWTGLPRC